MELMMFNDRGCRKYLTRGEIEGFIKASNKMPLSVSTFCLTIAYSGCRISEALALTPANIDFEAESLIVKCLKKRGKIVYRAIPLPAALLRLLRRLIGQGGRADQRLWPWSRMTGYRRICEVMELAGITGEHASPKGLRHGFAVQAIQSDVPLTLVQRWLGHANLKTTAIYTAAMGAEERKLAERMWGAPQSETGGRAASPMPKAQVPHPIRSGLPVAGIPAQTAIRYQLQYGPAAYTHEKPSRLAGSTAMPTVPGSNRSSPKKSLIAHLLDCALRQFWLKGNSMPSQVGSVEGVTYVGANGRRI